MSLGKIGIELASTHHMAGVCRFLIILLSTLSLNFFLQAATAPSGSGLDPNQPNEPIELPIVTMAPCAPNNEGQPGSHCDFDFSAYQSPLEPIGLPSMGEIQIQFLLSNDQLNAWGNPLSAELSIQFEQAGNWRTVPFEENILSFSRTPKGEFIASLHLPINPEDYHLQVFKYGLPSALIVMQVRFEKTELIQMAADVKVRPGVGTNENPVVVINNPGEGGSGQNAGSSLGSNNGFRIFDGLPANADGPSGCQLKASKQNPLNSFMIQFGIIVLLALGASMIRRNHIH